MNMHQFRSISSAIALSLTSILAGTVGVGLTADSVHAQVRALPDFTELVEQVGPSVVNIRTTEKLSLRGPNGSVTEGMDEDMLEFFRRFGLPVPNVPKGQAPRRGTPSEEERERPRGVGSGFVLTSDGFIMTNAHVVQDADEVWVTLTDKREFKAKIIGADKRTDVAVVKIEASALPAVKIGDVSRLKVGEWVMAIGSPFGLDNSVTAGIVSAKQRDTGDYLPAIQTDVAINPGNSGGPLINMRGEVVGINSQIYSRSGGYQGISFSIPIDEAVRVSEQLRATGRVVRGRIGVQIDAVTKEVAESIGLGKPRGALVRSVETGLPADKAGVQAGDIILEFDGKAIDKSADLPRLVGNTQPGRVSKLKVYRRGKTVELNVKIGEFESEDKVAKAKSTQDKPPVSKAGKTLGLSVSDLSDAQKKELRISQGVRVQAAQDAAARAGLREGDVILALGNMEVGSVKEFEAAVDKLDPTKPVSVLLRRGEWAQYLLIRPSKP
jgi:serine protease Do